MKKHQIVESHKRQEVLNDRFFLDLEYNLIKDKIKIFYLVLEIARIIMIKVK